MDESWPDRSPGSASRAGGFPRRERLRRQPLREPRPERGPTPQRRDPGQLAALGGGALAEERRPRCRTSSGRRLRADLERIAQWFDDGFDRDGVRGVAVFAACARQLLEHAVAAEPVADDVKIAGELYLAPLARSSGAGRRARRRRRPRARRGLPAAGGRARRDRRRERRRCRAGTTRAAGRRRATSGTSTRSSTGTARGRRRRSTAACAGCAGRRVVLVGAEEIALGVRGAALERGRGLRCSAGRSAEAHADAAGLLEVARPVLEEWWREARGGAARPLARGGRRRTAAQRPAGSRRSRPHPTAASSCCSSRTASTEPAYQCPACGRAQTTDGSCPLDGTTLERRENGARSRGAPDARARRHRRR